MVFIILGKERGSWDIINELWLMSDIMDRFEYDATDKPQGNNTNVTLLRIYQKLGYLPIYQKRNSWYIKNETFALMYLTFKMALYSVPNMFNQTRAFETTIITGIFVFSNTSHGGQYFRPGYYRDIISLRSYKYSRRKDILWYLCMWQINNRSLRVAMLLGYSNIYC